MQRGCAKLGSKQQSYFAQNRHSQFTSNMMWLQLILELYWSLLSPNNKIVQNYFDVCNMAQISSHQYRDEKGYI